MSAKETSFFNKGRIPERDKNMLKNIVLLGFERAMQALSLILIAGVLLRWLGDADYARWQYAMAVFSVFSALTWFLGNELVTVKLYQSGKKRLIKNFFFIKLFICIVFSVFYLGFAFFYNDKFFFYFALFTLWIILIREPFSSLISIYQYESRYDWVLISNLIALLVRVGCIFAVIYSKISSYWIGLAWLLEGLIFVLMVYGRARFGIKFSSRDCKISWLILKKNFLPAIKVWITVLAGVAFLKFDKISLASDLGYKEYSIYSSSSQINENALSVVALAMNVLGPYYLYKYKNKKDAIRRLYNSALSMFLLLSIFSLSVFFLQDFIGKIIFGSSQYTQYLWKLIFMAPIYGVSVVFNFFFFRQNEFGHTATKSLILLSFLCLINFLLTDYFNKIESVIISMYCSLLICLVYDVIYFLKWRRYHD